MDKTDKKIVSSLKIGDLSKEVVYTTTVKGNSYFFCPKCKKASELAVFSKTKGNKLLLTCPDCGYEVAVDRNVKFSENIMALRSRFTAIAAREIVCVKEGKVVISKYVTEVFPNIKGKLAYREIHASHVYNTKTGHSYALPVINAKTGKKVSKFEHISNIDYARLCHSFDAGKKPDIYYRTAETINAALKAICLEKGEEFTLINPQNLRFGFELLSLYNKYGFNNPIANYLAARKLGELTAKDRYILSAINKKNSKKAEKWIKKEADGENIPKSIKKFLYINPFLISEYKSIKNIFSDVNIIRSVLEKAIGGSDVNENISFMIDNFWNLYSIWGNKYTSYILIKSEFLKDYISFRGESSFAKIFVAANIDTLQDICQMYQRVRITLPSEPKERLLKGNYTEIHDRLSELLFISSYGVEEIPYTEEEVKTYCKKVGSLSFDLAKDTLELYKLHQAMRICVHTYSHKAVSKQCNIVIVRNEAQEPVVCMEFNPEKEAIQIKGFSNSPVKTYAGEVRAYLKAIKAGTDKCYIYDMEHIRASDTKGITVSNVKVMGTYKISQVPENETNTYLGKSIWEYYDEFDQALPFA